MRQEILVSINGEFTGPIPGDHSLISLGAVAYTYSKTEISRFKVNMEELSRSSRDPATMEWWRKHPKAWQLATENKTMPQIGMERFARWLKELPGTPKLIGWPLSADFLFVYWYYWYFERWTGGTPPFGFDGIDIKSYAMAVLQIPTLSEVSFGEVRKVLDLPSIEFSHNPVEDAAQQAEVFFALREMNMSR